MYRITNTLHLHSHTRLVGEGLSRLVLGDHAPGFGDVNSPKPMVSTPDDSAGTVSLSDLRLTSGAGNVGAVLLSWGVGASSSIWDVHITVGSGPEGAGGEGIQGQGEVHTLMLMRGAGGGVFSNIHGWGADHNVSNDAGLGDGHALHGLRASSSGPAYFIGCAFEHHTSSAFNLTGASNFTFFALQTEQTAHAVVIQDTDAVLVYGTVITWSGHDELSLVYIRSNSSRLELYGLNTLMKRQQSREPMWKMVSYEDDPSMSVPALKRSAQGSGNWGGRCGRGDCAMVANYI